VPDGSLELRLKAINHRADFALENLKRFQQGGAIWKLYVDRVLSFCIDIRAVNSNAREYFARATFEASRSTTLDESRALPPLRLQ